MWFKSFVPIVLLIVTTLADPQPGQLRVPKVYNAVITSNQNLAPSRAYPVIQPVVHRTAIGYVPPPFYYGPLPPAFGGPGILPIGPGIYGPREGPRETPREEPPARPDDVESVEVTDGSTKKKISRPKNKSESGSHELESDESSDDSSSSDGKNKKGKNDRVPLSFYPNYQSLYYDPYFYPYNAYPPHLAAPGTYYVNYPQPPGILGPLAPIPPPGAYPSPGPSSRPESANPEDNDKQSNRSNEKERIRATERREKIPDVPAPPVPTALRKKAS